MATVNEDNSPHNTPFRFLYKNDLSRIFWGSHPDSIHSQNILRTGQAFVVLYDTMERGGLYIKVADAKVLEGDELEEGLAVHNKARRSEGKSELLTDYYSGTSPQRMWSGDAVQFWVNGTERDNNDQIIRDIRTEVSREQLLTERL